MLRLAIDAVLALLTLCGMAFYLIALWSAQAFRKQPTPSSTALPAVSVLKPLKGADAQTYVALRSHCLQDYGAHELIFGVNDENDEAIPVLRRLVDEFPDRNIRLVICSEVLGVNRKVSNLIHLLREAKYQHVLVNDGDIRVKRDYLRNVMSHFGDANVGMVTCLYKGEPSSTLSARLESLGMSTDFAPGVLTARLLDGRMNFALGSTMAMSRQALEKIGGFHALIDYLADDYQLGQRIAAAGFAVVLATEVVETSIPPYSFSQFWEHQLRWFRTMRVSRPGGYLGIGLTYALPWAIALVLMEPRKYWVWALFAAALVTRFAVAVQVGWGVLRDHHIKRDFWLIPIRDTIALAVWAGSYIGNTVSWRGEKFRIEDGRMVSLETSAKVKSGTSVDRLGSEAQRR